MNTMVSINCIAYNQERYISDAIEGFLRQQTDFGYEILIHDDASTDRTAGIIEDYTRRYPDLIKPLYQTENQYSKGIKVGTAFNLPRAKGKYVAFCEGDDYWTDPEKLQKQVDYMESHPECSMCCHAVKLVKGRKVGGPLNKQALPPKLSGTYRGSHHGWRHLHQHQFHPVSQGIDGVPSGFLSAGPGRRHPHALISVHLWYSLLF